MVDIRVKTNPPVADIITGEKGKSVHPYQVGKWILGQGSPRGEKLIALARALKLSADLLVLEEGQNPEQSSNQIREIIAEVVKKELILLLSGNESNLPKESEVLRFVSSDKIPEEDKQALRRLIKGLLERYEGAL